MMRLGGIPIWAKVIGAIVLVVIGYFLVTSAVGGIKTAIFGNPEVKKERANTVIAREDGKAEAQIADQTVEHIRQRDVYREHVREIVREGQGAVNNAWKGETVGADVDAAGAATLCRMHDSLCRSPAGAPEVQPVYEPIPRDN